MGEASCTLRDARDTGGRTEKKFPSYWGLNSAAAPLKRLRFGSRRRRRRRRLLVQVGDVDLAALLGGARGETLSQRVASI